MDNLLSGILVTVAVAAVGYGIFRIIKARQVTSQPISELPIEKADTIKMDDLVAWFRSLKLSPQESTPFVCNNLNMFSVREDKIPTSPYVILGVYNESKDNLSPIKIVEVNSMDPQVQKLLDQSENGLVVLS